MPCCILKKNRRCAQPKVEVSKSKRGSKVEVNVTMRREVKVNQFHILYINREHVLPEQFPLRVQFLADASKNVAAKCEKKLALCSNIQTVDAKFDELCRGIGGRKRFQSSSRSKGFMKSCKILLWTIPVPAAIQYKNKRQKKVAQ